jgi:hypothetical protein
MVSAMTDGDNLPSLVSSELRERQPIWHFQGVLILRRKGPPPITASSPEIVAIVDILLRFIVSTSFYEVSVVTSLFPDILTLRASSTPGHFSSTS